MRILNAEAIEAMSQDTVPLVQLVRFDFPAETLGLNTSNRNFTYGGVEYRGAAGLGSIATIEDSPGEIKGLVFTLNGAASEMVALALDNSDEWQGTPITVGTAVLDQNYQIVDVLDDWVGFGDVMSLSEDGESCTLQATAESSAVDLTRSTPLTYSLADQRAIDPTDLGFSLIASQIEQPIVWPTKEWYYK
jgi:hypothetical protein